MSSSVSSSSSQAGTSFEYTSLVDLKRRTVDYDSYGYGECRNVGEFEKLNKVGEGTYGVVYRARDTKSGEIVALKKVRIDEKTANSVGISESAVRELALLKALRHENVVLLKDVAVPRGFRGVFLVMEYCEQDLASLLDNLQMPFTDAQVKCLMIQLFRALTFLHQNYVLHRDLKVSNLLLTHSGVLKVADFGLARVYGDTEIQMTPRVVTLWYRSPELLLGGRHQTPGVDIWASGCILGELLLHRPLLPGKTELDQIDRIVTLLGTPTTAIWPEMDSLPDLQMFSLRPQPYSNLKKVFDGKPASAIALLQSLFIFDPKRRLSAKEALEHPYFKEAPLPCAPSLMPSFPQHRNRKRKYQSED